MIESDSATGFNNSIAYIIFYWIQSPKYFELLRDSLTKNPVSAELKLRDKDTGLKQAGKIMVLCIIAVIIK